MVRLVGRLATRRSEGGGSGKVRPKSRARRPTCEALEGRELLTGLGSDYTLMGGQWDQTRPITVSIAPDRLPWSDGVNAVNSKLDAEFGGTSWHSLVSRALQTWAAATNLDFAVVGDGDFSFNSPGATQGDPRFGDIRIGGFDFGDLATIAQTYGPPPNGTTGAGDVKLNTAYDFSPGGNDDFQSVILHELGHSLGLGESPQPSAVMYSYYSGVRRELSAFDVEGIQSIYGARTYDGFQSQGLGTSAATAIDLTPLLGATNQADLAGLKLRSIGDVESFKVAAPAASGSTMTVTVRASGISQLSPKVTVIDTSTWAAVATGSDASRTGNDVSVSVPAVPAGHRYLIAVTGATGDVFSVGSYAVRVGFSGGTPAAPAPTPAPSPTPVPTPAPIAVAPVASPQGPTILPDRFAGNNSFATAAELGPMGQAVVTGLTMPSGQDVRVFTFEVASAGTVLVASGNTEILVADWMGRPVTAGTGLIGFTAPVTGSRYFLVFLSPNREAVPSFGFAVATIPAPPIATLTAQATPVPVATAPPTAVATKPTTPARSAAVPKGPASSKSRGR